VNGFLESIRTELLDQGVRDVGKPRLHPINIRNAAQGRKERLMQNH
jgi:hypothetical protein